MNLLNIVNSLVKFSRLNRIPPTTFWPTNIYLDVEINNNLRNIYNQTKLTGHEFETATFLVDNQMIYTPLFKGSKQDVRVNHKIEIKYAAKGSEYERQIVADGKPVKTQNIGKTIDPASNQIDFLFNIHSHPVYVNPAGQTTYSFFSVVDMNSFLNSNALVMGLVTDKFWLVGKTDKVISRIGENGEEMLYRISEGAFSGVQELDDLIKKEMNRWGMVFYKADFGKSLTKI